ncbi:MAG: hypothetical protein U9O24_10655 [Campylobacterota bacterium]|nr:hypothetical protein [Campylobacterota bacterium]
MSTEEENLHIDNISKKETFSEEEKKLILERLNNDRLIKQFEDEDAGKTYTKEEKKDVFERLNKERLRVQKNDEMKKKRLHNKKIYTFANELYYKLEGMSKEYYIKESFLKEYSGKPMITTIYSQTFLELKKRDVLIRTEFDSEGILISLDPIHINFKSYLLEDESE